MLATLAKAWGAEVRLLGIARDTVADLTGKLAATADADLIVTSGGVSLGDFDFVKDVLRSAGGNRYLASADEAWQAACVRAH